jgi:hypothetical protein
MLRGSPFHIYCEEWLLSTSNVKVTPLYGKFEDVLSDSYPHQMRRASPLHIKCEKWLFSTSNVKSDPSPRQMWRVTPLHIKSEELLLSMANLKFLLYTSNVKSDLFLRRVTSNVKSDSSPHQRWRVTPHYIKCEQWLLSILMWRVIPLYIVCEERLLSTSNLKSDSISNVKIYSSPHQMWTVTPLHLNVKSDSSIHHVWRVTSHHFKFEK